NSLSGTLPATLRIAAGAAGMSPGTYSGSVIITAAGAGNSPFLIPVVMTAVSAPALVANPSSLTLTSFGGGVPGAAPGVSPAAQTQPIYVASTAGSSPFAVDISDATCNNFLSVSP